MARWRASSSGAAAALTRRHVSFRPATPSFRATSTSSAPASASAPAAEAISFACTGDSSPARIAASTAGSSPSRAAVSSVAIAAPTDEPARRQPVGGGALTRASPEVGGGHPPRRQRLACGTQLLDGGEGIDQTRRRLGRQRLGLEGSHELAQLRFHVAQTHDELRRPGLQLTGKRTYVRWYQAPATRTTSCPVGPLTARGARLRPSERRGRPHAVRDLHRVEAVVAVRVPDLASLRVVRGRAHRIVAPGTTLGSRMERCVEVGEL